MRSDVCIIGNVTQDCVQIASNPPFDLPGGTGYYAGIAARRLGLDTNVITKLESSDEQALSAELRRLGARVHCLPSPATTRFTNFYSDPDTRQQRVTAVAAPFRPEELVVDAQFYMLGPLTRSDISLECVQHLAGRGRQIALDIQGLLRSVRGEQVVLSPCDQIPAMLRYVHILKANEEEARFATGLSDIEAAARALAAYGPREVLVTRGSLGSFILSDGRTYTIPAFPPPEVIDTTGCGDTYLAAYISRRLADEMPEQAGLFASRIAGAKTAVYGPYRGETEDPSAASQSESSPWRNQFFT